MLCLKREERRRDATDPMCNLGNKDVVMLIMMVAMMIMMMVIFFAQSYT